MLLHHNQLYILQTAMRVDHLFSFMTRYIFFFKWCKCKRTRRARGPAAEVKRHVSLCVLLCPVRVETQPAKQVPPFHADLLTLPINKTNTNLFQEILILLYHLSTNKRVLFMYIKHIFCNSSNSNLILKIK